jgi:A/G-specific adenine glycosylase
MDKRYFSKKVVEWYEHNKRELPWRFTNDPYKVWLSEIILQQTRVNQGMPYYLRFIDEFPTVNDLARAPEQKILRLWQGLGYYTRARSLHKCAKVVVEKFNGAFPTTFEELKTLPGIGDYTAAAIASICFAQPVAVVDGNVFRVLSRIFGIDTAINSNEGKKIFTELANTLIPSANPSAFNQAMMEFGALFCTPKNPDCNNCVFQANCIANKNNLQAQLPVKLRLKKITKRYFNYIVLQKGNSYGMKNRLGKDIWHGLYDFYLIEKKRATNFLKLAADDSFIKKHITKTTEVTSSKMYKHILSHQIIYARFYTIKLNGTAAILPKELKLYSKQKIASLPKPILINKYLEDEQLL